ncbi:MAG: hypothetical protein JO301_13435 [Chitinophagaceae bacterium]|nr:hypothetical protein [Chitinophagaceae bacterium]
MIEVFKTNVHEPAKAAELVSLLSGHFPGGRINFDLDDCDRILRIDKPGLCSDTVIELMNAEGFQCAVLE